MKINQRKNMKTIKPKYLINKKIFKNKKEKRKKGNLEWESTFSILSLERKPGENFSWGGSFLRSKK
jgi:hypothetical protein